MKKREPFYYPKACSPKFESQLQELCEALVLDMGNTILNEIKLRYITHTMAQTLDVVAEMFQKKSCMN